MKVTQTPISDLLVIELQVFSDQRGDFMESFSEKKLAEFIPNLNFVQDNHSVSKKNVIRGLHFQKPPFAQAKLVRVAKGSVIDFVLDIRANSPTYGELFSIELSAVNNKMLYVPEGFAHGFLSLEDDTHFLYKCSQYYNPESESGILYSSLKELLKFIKEPLINKKDGELEEFKTFKTPFL